MCTLDVLFCVCGVLGHLTLVHRCACVVCLMWCAAACYACVCLLWFLRVWDVLARPTRWAIALLRFSVAPYVRDTDPNDSVWPLELGVWTRTLLFGSLKWGDGLPLLLVAR